MAGRGPGFYCACPAIFEPCPSDSEFRGVPALYQDMNYPQQQSFRWLEKFARYRYFGSDYSCEIQSSW